jgi:hypothetical protein
MPISPYGLYCRDSAQFPLIPMIPLIPEEQLIPLTAE